MNTIKNICVLGDGGWGTSLALLLDRKNFNVTLWGVFHDNIEETRNLKENVKFLPGIKISESVKLTSNIAAALEGADLVVLAVPSQYMRGVLDMLKLQNFTGKIFVSVAKGIENNSLKRMSEEIKEIIGNQKFAVLSGPTIALEVANGLPSTAVAASDQIDLARGIQEVFSTDRFRVYASDDIIGVELGGSLKNVIAIAAGTLDGLGYGTNAKAALLTRGLAEIVRLGEAMGAKSETIYGLSGLGDLFTTCTSRYSRNRWFGEEVGLGRKMNDILKDTYSVVEGVVTAKSAYELSKKYGVDMPITKEVYSVLYENKDPHKAVDELMNRTLKLEKE